MLPSQIGHPIPVRRSRQSCACGAGGATTDYVTNNLNQILSAGDVTYDYDQNGNRTRKTDNGITTDYAYDAENRLISIDTPTDTCTYEYDALAIWRRSSRTVSGRSF